MKDLQLTITNDITYHEAKKRLENIIKENQEVVKLLENYNKYDKTDFKNYISSLIKHISVIYKVKKEDLKDQICNERYNEYKYFNDMRAKNDNIMSNLIKKIIEEETLQLNNNNNGV